MRLQRTLTALVTLAFGLALSSCGDDEAVSYSGDIGITLNLGSSDVDGTLLEDAKNITTESGNPCAEFLRLAEDRLGREPGGFGSTASRWCWETTRVTGRTCPTSGEGS